MVPVRYVLGKALVLAFLAATAASAADFPTRSIRWVLGFPAGGASDLLGRAIAERLSVSLKQNVIVDNRPGASGIIANDIVARATADGYTILMVSSTFANLKSLGRKLPYNPDKDLEPVTLLAEVPDILCVHPSLPAKSVSELVALAKSRPGQINYGTGGRGTGPHLATELFRSMTGINIMHIPYKGTPAAVNDLLAGRVQMMFALTPVSLPHVKAGRLRPLGVSGEKRLAELPQVPTIAESVPGYLATVWYGVMVPAGTPAAIKNRYSKEITKILADPAIQRRLATVGFETATSTPQEFTRFMHGEISKWKKVIDEANIKF